MSQNNTLPSHVANGKEVGFNGSTLRGSPTALGIRSTLNIDFSWTLAGFFMAPIDSIQFHMVSYCSAIKQPVFAIIVDTLRGKLDQLGSSNLQDIFIGR